MIIEYPGLIKCVIEKRGNEGITFTVLSQHISTRRTSSEDSVKSWKTTSGMGISSNQYPQVGESSDFVYVLGCKAATSHDSWYASGALRDAKFDRAIAALQEWSQLPGIRELWTTKYKQEQLNLWD